MNKKQATISKSNNKLSLEKESAPILVTAALPYINNVPHLGHVAGSHLPADIFARYWRAKGREVYFVGGSDEHGTPSVIAANELGLPVQTLVDRLHKVHKRVYEKLNISYDNYSRTSLPKHHAVTRNFFRRIKKNKELIQAEEAEMYYCEGDKMFLPDRFVVGTCPNCGYEGANADQCEVCSRVIAPGELIDPRCKICGKAPVMKKTKHLYLNLTALSGRLNEWIEGKKKIFRPYVYSSAKKWINEGLRPRSITRDLAWGVKVPQKDLANKVFYVWFDAPIGYVTFTKELGEKLGQELEKKLWQNKRARIYHFVGKDNIPFHTIFWPALLLAEGKHDLPYNVIGLNYLNYGGKKFSKSKGVGVFCWNLLDSPINIDTLRAYLATVIPETKDSDFKWEEYQEHTNSEVIGKLSNFLNRTLSMINNYFEGRLVGEKGLDAGGEIDNEQGQELKADSIGETDSGLKTKNSLTDLDKEILKEIQNSSKKVGDYLAKAEIRKGFRAVMNLARAGNVYLDRRKPWELMKAGQKEEAQLVLRLCFFLSRALLITATPFMPQGMTEIWQKQFGLAGAPNDSGVWDTAGAVDFLLDCVVLTPKPYYSKVEAKDLEELEKDLGQKPVLKEIVGLITS